MDLTFLTHTTSLEVQDGRMDPLWGLWKLWGLQRLEAINFQGLHRESVWGRCHPLDLQNLRSNIPCCSLLCHSWEPIYQKLWYLTSWNSTSPALSPRTCIQSA